MGLIARGLSAGYGGDPVLHRVDFAAQPGELVAVVGPNGSGKTTLLRALSGVLDPEAGAVELDGAPLAKMGARERARKLGFVPQSRPPEFAFNVREMVEMGRTAYLSGLGRLRSHDAQAVEGALRRVGILELSSRDASTLSAGQVQLVVLARALAQQPSVLLLDEPTAHLDLTHQIEVMEAVRSLVRDDKMAAVAVLHDLNLAAAYGDRIVLLGHGRVRVQGPPATVLTRGHIASGFGVDVIVRRHPVSGATYVVPFAVAAPAEPTVEGKVPVRVHVVCGGGSGAQVLGELVRAGYEVSVGVVNVLDTDFEVAQSLGLRAVAEAPFCGVSSGAVEEARVLAEGCRAVVLTPVPFGPSNEDNLAMVEAAAASGRDVYVMDPPGLEARDFTGGKAAGRVRAILAAGATGVRSASELLERMRDDAAPPVPPEGRA